jgi:hypothetical protein
MSEHESRNTTREGSLDELAKGLAGGTVSRGKALRMLGAALFGGAVASIPGAALAKQGAAVKPKNVTCTPANSSANSTGGAPCGKPKPNNYTCLCYLDAENQPYCGNTTIFSCSPSCTVSHDCPAGSYCRNGLCNAECGTDPASLCP